jgi:hypothetical protein
MEKSSTIIDQDKKCDKCCELREVDESQATSLVLCSQVHDDILEVMNCDWCCYKKFSLCATCFEFIQDPKNDEKIRLWEEKNKIEKISKNNLL